MMPTKQEEDHLDRLLEAVQELSDLELALLLCLITEQHCIVECEPELLSSLEKELRLAVVNVFGLQCSSVACSEATTVDDFATELLVNERKDGYFSSTQSTPKDEPTSPFSSVSGWTDRRPMRTPPTFSPTEGLHIANVVIARDLDKTHEQVQIQALELVRSKRMFTRTAVQIPPKPFLLVALLSTKRPTTLTQHLNDHIFISHQHDVQDDLPNVTAQSGQDKATSNGKDRMDGRIQLPGAKGKSAKAMLTRDDMNSLADMIPSVRTSPEIRGYIHNVVVFARMHRAVASGVSATATRHFHLLSSAIALLHGLSYITPSIVALAARKIYTHRIKLTAPENERSMQWGSSLEAVTELLRDITVEDVIDEVLDAVETPL